VIAAIAAQMTCFGIAFSLLPPALVTPCFRFGPGDLNQANIPLIGLQFPQPNERRNKRLTDAL